MDMEEDDQFNHSDLLDMLETEVDQVSETVPLLQVKEG